MNFSIKEFFRLNGIIRIYTTTGDSAANGVAERTNLVVLHDCRTLLQSSNLPKYLWFHAIQYFTIMRNACYNLVIKSTPIAHAGLAGLNITTVLLFGQPVIVHDPMVADKLNFRGLKGLTLPPSIESHGYLIFVSACQRVVDTSNYTVVCSILPPTLENDSEIAAVFD